ncbi:MAG: hypothetical protein WBS54_07950 [Acidobacteriota bacterium]
MNRKLKSVVVNAAVAGMIAGFAATVPASAAERSPAKMTSNGCGGKNGCGSSNSTSQNQQAKSKDPKSAVVATSPQTKASAKGPKKVVPKKAQAKTSAEAPSKS